MFILINNSCTNSKQKEEIMQQRFCNCGCKLWVEYLLTEWRCRTVFWSNLQRQGQRLKTCPACGSQLSIDDLY